MIKLCFVINIAYFLKKIKLIFNKVDQKISDICFKLANDILFLIFPLLYKITTNILSPLQLLTLNLTSIVNDFNNVFPICLAPYIINGLLCLFCFQFNNSLIISLFI